MIDRDINSWKIFHELEIPEMYDRMIFALFYSYGAHTIITNDPEISESVDSIWT